MLCSLVIAGRNRGELREKAERSFRKELRKSCSHLEVIPQGAGGFWKRSCKYVAVRQIIIWSDLWDKRARRTLSSNQELESPMCEVEVGAEAPVSRLLLS